MTLAAFRRSDHHFTLTDQRYAVLDLEGARLPPLNHAVLESTLE